MKISEKIMRQLEAVDPGVKGQFFRGPRRQVFYSCKTQSKSEPYTVFKICKDGITRLDGKVAFFLVWEYAVMQSCFININR